MKKTLQEDVFGFFSSDDIVCLLPSGKSPRLYFSDRGATSRRQATAFYPAFSRKAQWFRKGLQMLAFVGLIPRRKAAGHAVEFKRFMRGLGFDDCDLVVMIGTLGVTQKAIAQVKRGPSVVACLKYGSSCEAQERIRKEASMLGILPSGIAPSCLASGPLGDGEVVVMEYLAGRPLPARHPVPIDFLRRMKKGGEHSFLEHPWVQRMRAAGFICPEHYPQLRLRSWPLVLMHGDFAPWNLIRKAEAGCQGIEGGRLSSAASERVRLFAIDWESGAVDGFPFIDAAHYVIQSAQNLHQWKPAKAAWEAMRILMEMDENLSQTVVKELTRLTIEWLAFRDGLNLSSGEPREVWYRGVIDSLLKGA